MKLRRVLDAIKDADDLPKHQWSLAWVLGWSGVSFAVVVGTSYIDEFVSPEVKFYIVTTSIFLLLVWLAFIHNEAERHPGLLVIISVLIAVYGITTASNDAENQRFNLAWMVVNSPGPTCEPPKHNENEIAGGGRQEALYYLEKHGHGLSLQGADISRAIFSFANLDRADFNRSTLCNTDLFCSDLRHSSLWGAHATNANLQFAQLQGATLEYAELACADMRGAHLVEQDGHGDLRTGERTNLKRANLNHAHLEGADLRNTDLIEANVRNAHLGRYIDDFNADKDGGCWRYSDGLIGLRSRYPDSFDPLLSSKTDPELNEFCEWFRNNKHPSIQPKFCNKVQDDKGKRRLSDRELVTVADLSGAVLTGANLCGTDLTGAIVTKKQINSAGRLCHTILPDGISVEDRGCSKDQNSEPACDRDERMNTIRAAARHVGPHAYICKRYSEEPWYSRVVRWRRALSRARHEDACIGYTDFALEHNAIKTRCVERAIVQSPSNDPLGDYVDCLNTHSHAIDVQKQVDGLSHFIKEAGAEVVKVMELEWNFLPFNGKTIAVGGFLDKVVSGNEALFLVSGKTAIG